MGATVGEMRGGKQPFEGHARVLIPDEEHRGERALARRHGLGRELFERAP